VPPEMREACRSVENDRGWLPLELSRPVRVPRRAENRPCLSICLFQIAAMHPPVGDSVLVLESLCCDFLLT
jgi:hypothetical protein